MTSPTSYSQPAQTSGLAIGSMVVGFFCICLPILSPVALVLGHIALSGIKKSQGSVSGGGFAICGLVTGYLGLLIGIVVYSFVYFAVTSGSEAEQDEAELFSIPAFDSVNFPDLKEGQVIDGSEVLFHDLSLIGGGPAGHTQLRIYLPPGEHADASLACVLVAPAGTNLLSGADLDESDYHDEALPYAEAGMVVVTYSLDGADDNESAEADGEMILSMRQAYTSFKSAGAGVANGVAAFEFVVRKLPMVAPEKIFTAGHSSAANVSLLMAAHESRLAGSIAYAPACDVAAFHHEVMSEDMAGLMLPQVDHFLVRSSPLTHASKTAVPVFLFASDDDFMIEADDLRSYATQAEQAGSNVELKTVPSGGHYDSMIDDGIPAGIEWIKERLSDP